MNERIQKQVENRITWALEEQRSARTKVYDLLTGTPGLKENPLWQEIAGHFADCESHLINALRRFQQEGTAALDTEKDVSLQRD